MTDLPWTVIGIGLAILGFALTRLLAPRTHRPLSAMQPEFDQTALDEDELGNEALDMDMIRRVQAENERIGIENGYRWSKPKLRSSNKH